MKQMTRRSGIVFGLVIANLFGWLGNGICADRVANDAAAQTAYDFTPCFTQFVKDPSTQNTLSLEESGFVAGKPALRMDCRNLKGRLIVVNFYVPDDRLVSFRGKPVVFRSQVKWLEGEGTLSVTLRCSTKKKGEKDTELIVWTSTTFKGEKGKWVPFELHCMIPDRDDLIWVNFHTGLTKSNKPAVILLDECSMTLDDSGKNAPKRPVAFAAYETPPSAQPLVLVRDGKPAATIVVSEPMSSSVRFAVQELNEHLELSTGVKLAVAKDGDTVSGPTVHVGKTTLTSRLGLAPEFLSPDNWTVCRAGDALILSGGDNTINVPPWNRGLVPFGTLYAVYEFLERVVGVRWYWPGDLGRVVPKHDAITVGNIAWDGAPSYDTRFAFYSNPKEFSGEETYKWWRRLRWGGVGGDPIGMHSFGHWNKKFGKEHPAWFALQRNGQRGNNPDAIGNEAGHLCYSNPDVLKAVITEKREYFDKNPGSRYATVMDGDSSDLYWCQCPDCQAMVRPEAGGGMHSHPMWKFVNQVAAEIRKSHPDRIITCCAYTSYSAMPEDVEFLPNVSATLCVGYLPNVWRPSCKSDYLKLIRDWSKKTAYIYVWDYLFARRGVGVYGAPSIMPHAFKEWYALEQGRVKGRVIELSEIYSNGKSSHDWADWMFDALNMYVAMKLLWNLDQDVDKMLAEHYELFYGPAGPMVRKFYDEMEAAWVNPDNKGFPEPKWDWSVCWTMTYPPEFIQRVMGYLREAEKISKGKEPYHARAEKLLIGFLPFEAAGLRYSQAGAAIQNEKLELPETGAAPVIDGKPDDACWQTAVVAKDFCDMFNNPKLQVQTAMRFLRDKTNLYVAIQADLKDPKYKQTLAPGSRDGWVWEQESCELFFVQEDKKYQFLIGPDNIYADSFHPDLKQAFKREMFQWNCAGVQYKSVAGEKVWTAEIAIPLASLELPAPTKEKPWRVNFCRNHYYTAGSPVMQLERSSWRPTFGSFHDVERFGKLFFMNQ